MPFNARAQCVAGVGDGIVSIDKVEVFRGGGGACWLDDDRVIFGGHWFDGWRTLVYDQRTKETTLFSGCPAQFLAASAGKWGAVGPNGFVGSAPLGPEWRLSLASTDGRGAADQQGTIAFTQQSGQGFTLIAANGEVTEGAPGFPAYNLTVVSHDQAIWPVAGGFATLNLPVPQVAGQPGRACWCVVNGRAWIVYACDGLGLIAHPIDDASRGVVIENQGRSFHYFAIAFNGTIRVRYAGSTAERPEEMVIRDLDLAALVPLGAAPAQPVDSPVVAPWPRKIWHAPFFSHSERYPPDTPLDQHVGNAICVVPDEREPQASILRELDRIRPLGQPMIVASGNGLIIPAININTTIAWWVAAGRADDFPAVVQPALARPEKPVIAYLDGDGWPVARPSWVGTRVWPSVQAYRHPGELLAAFAARVRGVLDTVAAYGRPMVLTPRFDDYNGQGSIAATLECMRLYESWIREFEIVGVMPFADRRGNAIAKNPALRAWAKAFLDATPARPNRFDYWDSTTSDVVATLRNKLGQSTSLITLTDAEKKYLLARLT